MITFSKQDFLKNIYKQQEKGEISTSASHLADVLQVSNAAISDMSKRLSNEGLIHYQPYKGLILTEKGEKEALKVLRRHRLWELFLTKTLDLDWSEVHDEAENLEHLSSNFLISKIDAFLDYPKFDPHGSPIPDKEGNLPDMPELISLQKAQIGETYKVARVMDNDSKVIRYLGKSGLVLGAIIKVLEKFDYDDTIGIMIGNKEMIVSDKVGHIIYLEEI